MPAMNIPSRLNLLTVRKTVLLPFETVRIVLSEDDFGSTNKSLFERDSVSAIIAIGILVKQDSENEASLNPVGVAARISRVTRTRINGGPVTVTLTLQGICRVEISHVEEGKNRSAAVKQITPTTAVSDSLASEFRAAALELSEIKALSPRVQAFIPSLGLDVLSDLIAASFVSLDFEDKLAILNLVDVTARCEFVLSLIRRQQSQNPSFANELKRAIEDLKDPVPRSAPQRDQKEVSNDDDALPDVDTVTMLKQKIVEAKMPAEARKIALGELNKVKQMEQSQNMGPEHHKMVGYIEWLVALPWSKCSPTKPLSLLSARAQLDADHYGLDKIKKRILEYLAVSSLSAGSTRAPTILCLVGPPGVGKTSLGRSIAQTLGREFHRVALGGIRDEADIRGFNRTYVGSQPGRIITALKRVGVNNPVFMLDEVDKINRIAGVSGDPAAALLEVLDPAQNTAFVDHYIGIPFDLSKIVFIATANETNSIPRALLDRMEVIEIAGYTIDEKVAIATTHILPRALEQHGLKASQLRIDNEAIVDVCEMYSLEPGVRGLERNLHAVCRHAAVKLVEVGAEKLNDAITITPSSLATILGPPLYRGPEDLAARLRHPGVAIGLAAGGSGGSIMFIEVVRTRGSGKLVLTGNLGDIIKESAHIALGWIKSHPMQCGVETELLEKVDLHIHFPSGAVEKDGPSGGVALVVAIVSCLTERLFETSFASGVRWDTAMTGEITLTGTVLPVGGIEQKVTAAHRRGIRRVILPRHNFDHHVGDLPKEVQRDMEFVAASHIDDVLRQVFSQSAPVLSKL